MEQPTQTPATDSSPVAFEVPTDPAQYQEWRRTGTVTPKAAPTPAKESSEAKPEGDGEGDQASGKPADSEPKPKQERQPSKAEQRLNELLEDLRSVDLAPAELRSLREELKGFKRHLSKAPEPPKEPPKAAPEKTENPDGPKPPKKPKYEDFKTWEEYEEAKDKWLEETADFRAEQRIAEREAKQQKQAQEQAMQAKLDQAKGRYGDGSDKTIVETAKSLFGDEKIPGVITALANESDVLVDVLYTLGSKPEDLADFIDLCKTKPGQAVRKFALIENLVREELGKAKAPAKTESPERDSSGKFVSQKEAPKKESSAPPPPRETSGRSSPPPDEVTSAVEGNDFARYRAAANRKEIAARKGL